MPSATSAFFARFRRTEVDADGNIVPKLPSSVSAGDAMALIEEGATLVDVREKSEWRSGHAPHALHIPLAQVGTQVRRISQQRPVVVMCASGARSRTAASQLRKAGYRATSLAGGIAAWQAAGGSVRGGR